MQILLVAIFGFVTIAGIAYVSFEVRLLLGYLFVRGNGTSLASKIAKGNMFEGPAPKVLVQVPLYNEGAVAIDVVSAGCALEYPPDRLQIQVLDDSTDDTSDLLVPLIAHMRAAGVD